MKKLLGSISTLTIVGLLGLVPCQGEQREPNPQTESSFTVANADGSVDVYFGPQAAIGKEKNWIKTIAGKGWFLYLRFCGPTEAFFNQTWKRTTSLR